MKKELSERQKRAVEAADIQLTDLHQSLVLALLAKEIDIQRITDEELVQLVKVANATYRDGEPIVEDGYYDQVLLANLELRQPGHPYLHNVEPEPDTGKTVELPARMLSTRKAYTEKEVFTWIESLKKAASKLDLNPSQLGMLVTPKLDGFAAYDDGERLFTRGDGRRGADISRMWERGLKVGGSGQRGQGAGEIVTNKSYFKQYLAEYFDSSRNIQAAILAEKNIDPIIQKAIDVGAAKFMPFSELSGWRGNIEELTENLSDILRDYANSPEYDTDGVVLETTDVQVKDALGSSRNYNRWQLAFKVNQAGIAVEVIDVEPNTSRLGRVNPTAILKPTWLSGATISRATAHHFRMVREKGIGPGAIIKIVRSGLVIPKIQSVTSPVEPKIPTLCPSCQSELIWRGDHIYCQNSSECPAQAANSIEHFFKTLGNNDGFGPQTVEQLQENGINRIADVYRLSAENLVAFGFGEKTAHNLIIQLKRSRKEQIEDWRLLAAFGIERLGPGNSEKLLSKWEINQVFDLSKEQIASVSGLGDVTAETIYDGLRKARADAVEVMLLGFTLEKSSNRSRDGDVGGPLSGISLIFTGEMQTGTRDEMERQAKLLGATVGSSVSKKTNYLVAGENPGEKKIRDAEAKNVKILSEDEFRKLVNKKSSFIVSDNNESSENT